MSKKNEGKHEARRAVEWNRCRKELGMPKLVKTTTICLKCGDPFKTFWPKKHRKCDECITNPNRMCSLLLGDRARVWGQNNV